MFSIPILFCAAGAFAAIIYRAVGLERHISFRTWSMFVSLAPLSGFIITLYAFFRNSAVFENGSVEFAIPWLPSLGVSAVFHFDGLAALFSLLITGIGFLVVVYSAYYFDDGKDAWRFNAYLMLFMTFMLALVLAGDILTLFVFWEGTSIVSFLLVGYKFKDRQARLGALRALTVTATGGVVMLIGFVLLWTLVGSTRISDILAHGEILRGAALYPVILVLILIGAFTKSAQMPFHFWLPGAMSAPTPASAYLHSATMVKAGVYLLARLNPALGNTELWFWILTIFGGVTMLGGAYLGLKQNDLKALLAYSTISQLGVMVMMVGQDTEIAFKALVIAILSHGLYKSALFMSVGIIDHKIGSRDLRRLGGLRRAMPFTFVITSLAALSMAGLPPLFGFLAKETLLTSVTHPSVPWGADVVLTIISVIAGALLLAQSLMLIFDVFGGQQKIDARRAPIFMALMPGLPALISLLVGLVPEPEPLARLLAYAAGTAFGDKVKVSLALWTGLNIPFMLSVVAIVSGTLIFFFRQRIRAFQESVPEILSLPSVYEVILGGIDRIGDLFLLLQNGNLRRYLSVILFSGFMLVIYFGGVPFNLGMMRMPALDFAGELAALRIFALMLTVAAAGATVFLRKDFPAIIALGASGLGVALLMILEPAPDVALVQIIVDLLLVVILVLTLTRLPRSQRRQADDITQNQSRFDLLRDFVIALLGGLVFASMVFYGLHSRPRESRVTPFYETNAKTLTGAQDIVGAIIVDYRALDTLIEITVFSLAGVGVFTLLRFASSQAGDGGAPETDQAVRDLPTRGIGGKRASPLVRGMADFILPAALLIAVVHVLYGHDRPGDGFTAGVIVSLALGFWYVVFGYEETRRRLRWGNPIVLVGAGLGIAILNALLPLAWGLNFAAHIDFGKILGLSLPTGVSLSTALVFEAAIFVAVLGGTFAVLDALGHPDRDESLSGIVEG